MLAMDFNDNPGCLKARGVWTTIASVLAPTVTVFCRMIHGWNLPLRSVVGRNARA